MPNLRAYRRRFAQHVGSGLLAGICDPADSSTRTYLSDPSRRSSVSTGDDLVEWYLHRPEAAAVRDRVRVVAEVDLTAGRIFGDFPPGDQWDEAPAPGEVYELLAPEFHPTQLHDYLNESLKFCLVPAELTLPRVPVPGRQPVTDFAPWLTTAQHLYRVGSLSGTGSRETVDPYRSELRGAFEEVAGAVYLRLDGGLPASGASIGTLVADLPAGALALADADVTEGAGWPSAPPFFVTIDLELVKVTGHAGGAYQLQRGYSTTNDAAHPAGMVLMAPGQYVLHGLFPAYSLCRAAGGEYGEQEGLELDTDEAIPEEQWVVAGALKEAWLTAPQTMEQLAERMRLGNLEQASLAFQRWQAVTRERMPVHRSFVPVGSSAFNTIGPVR